jgi:integrase
MTEPLPQGFSPDEIEPVRPMVADPIARVSRKNGGAGSALRQGRPACGRVAPSHGYRWSVPVNPARIAKHYLTPALAAMGVDACALA